MENLFYFCVIVYLMFSFFTLSNNDKLHQWSENLRKNPERELNSSETMLIILMFTLFLFSIVGLLSSQWFLFLIIFINGVISIPFRKFKNIRIIINIIEIICLLFILINKYQLRIQFENIFLKWINN